MPSLARAGFAVLGVCLAGVFDATAAGATLINPVSQTRTISAQAQGYEPPNWISDSQSDSALDFGLFDSSVSAQVETVAGLVSASARQVSSIGFSGVDARGSADSIIGPLYSVMIATSHFELIFDVLEPLAFLLSGYVEVHPLGGFVPLGGETRIELTGGPANLTIAHFSLDGWYGVYEEGVLLPGQYTLIAYSRVNASGYEGLSGSYQLALDLVPEPSTGLMLAGGLVALALQRRLRST